MDMTDRLDPELAGPLQTFLSLTGGGFSLHDIPAARQRRNELAAAQMAKAPIIEGVTSEDRYVPGPPGAPDVFVRIYQPTDRPASLPALVWIHGGAMSWAGSSRMIHWPSICPRSPPVWWRRLSTGLLRSIRILRRSRIVMPRSSGSQPIATSSVSIRSRIALGGASAGGGLAAGLALLTRDRAEVELAYQLLIYPMIDDRNVAPASETAPDTFVWSRENNLMGWRAYLGHEPGGADVSPYAAAARATDLSGLPPAYIPVGDLDLFLDENIDYARRLLAAGVPTELHVYPGGYHGFNGFAPGADIVQRFNTERDQALKRALHR